MSFVADNEVIQEIQIAIKELEDGDCSKAHCTLVMLNDKLLNTLKDNRINETNHCDRNS